MIASFQQNDFLLYDTNIIDSKNPPKKSLLVSKCLCSTGTADTYCSPLQPYWL